MKNTISLFWSLFDPVLQTDGFIRKFRTYWHIDFSQGWYIAVWPRMWGQAHTFDIQFDLGSLQRLSPDDMKNMHRFSAYSFLCPSAPSEPSVLRLWRAPDDFPNVLQIYQNRFRASFLNIHSLYDLYVFDRKLHSEHEITLSNGSRWIDILLSLGRVQEAMEIIPCMRKWANSLSDQLNKDEITAHEKIAYYHSLGKSTKDLFSDKIRIYQKELSLMDSRKSRIDSLQHKITALEAELGTNAWKNKATKNAQITQTNSEAIRSLLK